MTSFRIALIATCFGVLPTVASADVITPFATAVSFQYPALAATKDCQHGFSGSRGSVELVEQQGVRIDFSNPNVPQNTYACDDGVPVFPTGWAFPDTPYRDLLLDDTGLRPLTIWAADSGWFKVTSLSGSSLLGFTFNARRSNLAGGVCSESLLLNGIALPLCDGLDQFYAFDQPAQSFFVTLRWLGPDPSLQIVSITVPEPPAALLIIGALPLAALWRRYRVTDNTLPRV